MNIIENFLFVIYAMHVLVEQNSMGSQLIRLKHCEIVDVRALERGGPWQLLTGRILIHRLLEV